MGENSAISWTDHTMNFWVGCTKVSAACDHCYAESWAKRSGHPELWTGERRRTTPANWRQPRKWNDAVGFRFTTLRRPRVFTNSLADFFDNQVPDDWRVDAWRIIRETPNLDWLILTKRPQNIAKMLPPDWGDGWPNVWLGTTCENQEIADRNIPILLRTPAAVRFVSLEPLLGPIDLGSIVRGCLFDGKLYPDGKTHPLGWVIAGGESGPHARPMKLEWVRDIRDQCVAAGIAFHFKQHGGLRPGSNGCLLDGREYKEFPVALAA